MRPLLGALGLVGFGLALLVVGMLLDGGREAERLVRVGVIARGGGGVSVLVLSGCALGVVGLLGACGVWLFGGRA